MGLEHTMNQEIKALRQELEPLIRTLQATFTERIKS